MKSTFRRICSVVLVLSLLFQSVPAAFAQPVKADGPMAFVRADLLEARRILSSEGGAKVSQDALPPLDHAKQLVGENAFVRAYPDQARELRKGIEKARLKVLWNDRSEALSIVNRLLGLADTCAKPPVVQTPCGNGPGAATALGATLIAGLGAVLVALMFGFGQVSHR
ncbi:MAG TPA: hypothetical protein PLP29_11540 [Candidatus Ozemobacteraceae bacterium]|nr:hypothetical protein [Candidatus Ozemobacteraceae bacterium]